MSITNDSVKQDYLQLISTINKKLNISINIFPEITMLKKDSLLFKKYVHLKNVFSTIFKEDKLISCIDTATYYKNNLGLSISKLTDNELNEDSILLLLNSGTQLFITDNVEKITNKIKNLLDEQKINEDDLNNIVKKVLLAKNWAGLNNNIRIEPDSVFRFINNKHNIAKINAVYKNSIALLKNENNLIPFKEIQNKSFAIITNGNKLLKFNETFGKFHNYKNYNFNTIQDIDFNKIGNLKTRQISFLLLIKY